MQVDSGIDYFNSLLKETGIVVSFGSCTYFFQRADELFSGGYVFRVYSYENALKLSQTLFYVYSNGREDGARDN